MSDDINAPREMVHSVDEIGRPMVWIDKRAYDKLTQENARLKAEIEALKNGPKPRKGDWE